MKTQYKVLGKIDNMGTPWRIEMYKDHGKPMLRACSEFDYYGITVKFPLRKEKRDIGYVWYIYREILPQYLQEQINSLISGAEKSDTNQHVINDAKNDVTNCAGKKAKCA